MAILLDRTVAIVRRRFSQIVFLLAPELLTLCKFICMELFISSHSIYETNLCLIFVAGKELNREKGNYFTICMELYRIRCSTMVNRNISAVSHFTCLILYSNVLADIRDNDAIGNGYTTRTYIRRILCWRGVECSIRRQLNTILARNFSIRNVAANLLTVFSDSRTHVDYKI